MHGGAAGSGAPAGNKNAWKHGLYEVDTREVLRQLRALLRDAKEVVELV